MRVLKSSWTKKKKEEGEEWGGGSPLSHFTDLSFFHGRYFKRSRRGGHYECLGNPPGDLKEYNQRRGEPQRALLFSHISSMPTGERERGGRAV